jgi:DNA mismatch repair protein MutS
MPSRIQHARTDHPRAPAGPLTAQTHPSDRTPPSEPHSNKRSINIQPPPRVCAATLRPSPRIYRLIEPEIPHNQTRDAASPPPDPRPLCYHPPVTPIRRQYLDIKRRFPTAIVFFRLGDFYETFDDDAKLCARELDLVLTSRPLGKDVRVPMAGIPAHAVNTYLSRLIARGHRVAICDQIGDPLTAKGLVERKVTRVVTPGTLLTDDLLRGPSANYLAALVPGDRSCGLAYIDVSTGEFVTGDYPPDAIAAELARLTPSEMLTPDDIPVDVPAGVTRTPAEPRSLDPDWAERRLREHFGVATLEAYGCVRLPLAVCAAAAIVAYLAETQPAACAQATALRTHEPGRFMLLDAHTRRNLELFAGGRPGESAPALLSAIDRTKTAMGLRLLRTRLGQPLCDPEAIAKRLDQVQRFADAGLLRAQVREHLARVPDLERLLSRTLAAVASPRDLLGLRRGIDEALAIRDLLRCHPVPEPSPRDPPHPSSLIPHPSLEGADAASVHLEPPPSRPGPPDTFAPPIDVAALVSAALADDAPATLADGNVIRPGFDSELDALRGDSRDARRVLAELERSERERTGIRSLKVGYNRVFGYYIEVGHAHQASVPAGYQRRQTLAGAERYVTPELQEYERRVLGADERIAALEETLFRRVCGEIAAYAGALRVTAAALAGLDVSAGLAEVAVEHGYRRPTVDGGDRITIRDGRHPVVEQVLDSGAFVPNDTALSANDQIVVLTGPNMAGKSTYLRQVALIVLLAQVGSYVPATSAHIGVVDRIFSRIGAHDDLAGGASTFMVEMVETAQILHHATPRSLVILDEVGRGTSTYDGLSIARAVVEYLHNRREAAAKTLFATHYHELTALANILPRVSNATVAVTEQDGDVVFLRRIIPGGADRSYGVHVAQLAGLPRAVVTRAQELLRDLESSRNGHRPTARRRIPPAEQLSLFANATPDPILEELAALDIDALTPLDALTKLHELRQRARGAGATGGMRDEG